MVLCSDRLSNESVGKRVSVRILRETNCWRCTFHQTIAGSTNSIAEMETADEERRIGIFA